MIALKAKIYVMFDNFKMNKFEGIGIIKRVYLLSVWIKSRMGMDKSQNPTNFFPPYVLYNSNFIFNIHIIPPYIDLEV